MKKWVVISLLLLVLLAAGAARAVSYYQQRVRQQEIALQQRIRALAEQNEGLGKELQSMKVLMGKDAEQRRIEKYVESTRGLTFKKRVRYQRMTRAELPSYLIQELRSEYSQEEFKLYLQSLSVMGFLPKDIDLEKLLVELMSEQIAAFYDPKKGELFTFETFDLSRTTDQVIYAHEVTHALQDQNFDLYANTPLLMKDNDDRVIAAKALVEGDATLLMNLYFADNFDAVRFFSKDLMHMLGQPVEKLAKAPAYLRDSLLFAYQDGQVFCSRLFDAGGFDKINEAFQRLPESSEQILHPEKYLEANDPPVEINWPPLTFAGWKKLGDNVAGELGVKLLLSEEMPSTVAAQAAQGWGGDRYQVYRVILPGGQETGPRLPLPGASRGQTAEMYAVIWSLEWDTEKDAAEFLKAYTACYVKRNALAPVDQSVDNDAILLGCGGRQQTFARKGKSVLILDVPTAKDADTLMKLLWQKKAEK